MNVDDLEWIEKFYGDLEEGFLAAGKTYVRPKDYIERALRVLQGKRNSQTIRREGQTKVTNYEY